MQTLETIKARRSVRAYTDKQVPDDVLDTILEAGTWAPSGMGKQAGTIIAVTDPELRDKLSKMNAAVMNIPSDPFYGAPCVVLIVCDASVPTHTYDGPLIAQNIMLAAADLGVDSCYIFRGKQMFETDEGKAVLADLGVQGDVEGNAIVILGYAAEEPPAPKPRKEGYIIKR